MASNILPFQLRETNILRFPSNSRERRNLELHRIVDSLVDAGYGELLTTSLRGYRDSFIKRDSNNCPEAPQINSEPKWLKIKGVPEQNIFGGYPQGGVE